MKRPEWWKVRRELWRVREQLRRGLMTALVEPVRQRRYDRRAATLVRRQMTGLPLGPKVAVFVLFQPRGLLASTHLACDHLRDEGFSIVIVSNAPLPDADRATLATRAAVILERPNVGYDFGGYREGIRWLEAQGHRPDRLVLMNDSTWFPLRGDDDTLRRMEAGGADLAGHIYKVEETEKRGRDHVESHLLLIGPRLLAHPDFARFWRDYRMSDERTSTVERGEKGITQMALAAGMRVEGLLLQERMVALFAALPDDALKDAIRHIVHHRDDARAHCAAILAEAEAGRPWRQAWLDWVAAVLSNSRQHLISATFIDAAMRLGGMGFVKKANDHRHQLGRLAVLRGLDEGRIAPLHPVVRQEIERAAKDWTPPFDWRHNPKIPVQDRL